MRNEKNINNASTRSSNAKFLKYISLQITNCKFTGIFSMCGGKEMFPAE